MSEIADVEDTLDKLWAMHQKSPLTERELEISSLWVGDGEIINSEMPNHPMLKLWGWWE